MAFASMKYPPGSFPPGGVYGEGAIFEQLPLQDGGKRLSVGSSGGGGGGSRSRIGSSDYGSQQHMSHSRSHGMLVSPRTSGTAAAAAAAARNVAGGHRHHGIGIRSNEASPVIGAATTPTSNSAGRAAASGGFGVQGGSPAAASSGRGTPGPPPGLGSANPGFSPSSVSNVSTHSLRSVGAFSTESASSLSQQRQVRHSRGASGGGGKGDDEKGTHEVDLDYFDFGELDTAAVLGL
ncbi:unnamed protein product [Ectocarpus sp. 4 AP-2014]